MPEANGKRTRRTPEQLIADLEKKIDQVKRRAEQRKAKKDPTLRHVTGAVRAIDKALAVSEDRATKSALDEARATLGAVLTLNGVMHPKGNGRVAVPKANSDRVNA